MWDAGFTLYYKVLRCEKCGTIHKKEISQKEYWKLEETYFVEVETV
jgi:uncharacterized Zn finger protein